MWVSPAAHTSDLQSDWNRLPHGDVHWGLKPTFRKQGPQRAVVFYCGDQHDHCVQQRALYPRGAPRPATYPRGPREPEKVRKQKRPGPGVHCSQARFAPTVAGPHAPGPQCAWQCPPTPARLSPLTGRGQQAALSLRHLTQKPRPDEAPFAVPRRQGPAGSVRSPALPGSPPGLGPNRHTAGDTVGALSCV